MCGPAPSLSYSPRTLVAVAVDEGQPASGGEGDAGGGAPSPSFGSPGAAWRNLTQPMPLRRKVRLVVRNVRIRVKMRQPCCGHPGEPGC